MRILQQLREFKRHYFSEVRRWFLYRRYHFKGKEIVFGMRLNIQNPQYISVGDYVVLSDDLDLNVYKSFDHDPQLVIEDHVRLGRNNTIGCDNKIIIERDVITAPFVHITDRNHCFEDVTRPITKQGMMTSGPVVIGAETWLGYGAQVMSGVTIGRHCVIAAGSIVTRDIPDYSVAAGCPARVIKRYNFDTQKWE